MERIADYEFAEKLGTGNHGTFYRAATPQRLGVQEEWVAIKVLDKNATDDDFRRFVNELKLFAVAHSDHLVPVHEAGQQSGRLFYAMPYYRMGSLGNPREPITDQQKIKAVADAARGAHALHEIGVAHRDIKPTNILLDEGGARLSDLGLAQVLNPGQTVTGTGPIGSIEFMEPGVVRGEAASRASDIWELAATLHKALTDKSVFGDIPAGSVLEALRHVLQSSPAVSDELTKGLRDCLERALAGAADDRQATADQFADELEEALT